MKPLLLSAALMALATTPVLAQDTTTPTPPPATEQGTTDPATDPTTGTGDVTTPPAVDPSVDPATPPADTMTPPADTMTAPTDPALAPEAAVAIPPEGFTAYTGEMLTSEELKDAQVYSSADESISSISDLVLDGDGKVTEVILDVGGFLGIGTRSVAIPYEDLDVYADENRNLRIYLPMTREQIEALPERTL
jgi:sporulation protein YlmC with PRC-barrel domain